MPSAAQRTDTAKNTTSQEPEKPTDTASTTSTAAPTPTRPIPPSTQPQPMGSEDAGPAGPTRPIPEEDGRGSGAGRPVIGQQQEPEEGDNKQLIMGTRSVLVDATILVFCEASPPRKTESKPDIFCQSSVVFIGSTPLQWVHPGHLGGCCPGSTLDLDPSLWLPLKAALVPPQFLQRFRPLMFTTCVSVLQGSRSERPSPSS